MNQAILFNDDLVFDEKQAAWCFTAQASGQLVTIYCHSAQLEKLEYIDNCTKFDIEEIVELWFEKNELEGDVIHIKI
ncbi:hypothetical protein L3081_01375 [Colwellia sp. MSW7]|jgi:hypothetical protein|uniref:DUF3630 family protein n=1 Tax=Colwellia maritima TaxID=2912588 RepID=A0ABS9WYL9_9GAMM|nr:hypothetical protein [Colwellia maritima]MCI2282296.1 hypothetical protein [Colwellia maritima]